MSVKFVPKGPKHKPALVQIMVPNRWQTIKWSKDSLLYKCINVPLGLNEIKVMKNVNAILKLKNINQGKSLCLSWSLNIQAPKFVITVPTDVLEPNGIRPSTGMGMGLQKFSSVNLFHLLPQCLCQPWSLCDTFSVAYFMPGPTTSRGMKTLALQCCGNSHMCSHKLDVEEYVQI